MRAVPRYSAEVDTASFSSDVAAAIDYMATVEAVGRYLTDVAVGEQIMAYVEAVDRQAELDAALREVRNVHCAMCNVQSPESGIRTAAPQNVAQGGCSDFPLPAAVIQRESGGDPNAVNPSSGTFGCAQLQPFHFTAPNDPCYGMSTDHAGQVACVEALQRVAGMDPWK